MDGLGTAVATGLGGFGDEALLVLPAGLAVAAVLWGAPKLVGFFKRLAK